MLTRQKGKNQYQEAFAELHWRFGVARYKHVRQEQYDAAKEGRERQAETGDE